MLADFLHRESPVGPDQCVVACSNGRPASGHTEVRMKSILDPAFRYTSSANTDIRKTFARVRRELRRQAQPNARQDADNTVKVTPIFRNQRPAA
jgi:hypothetical protein